VERNVCKLITVDNNNTFISVQKYDVILANINKNVIVGNFSSLVFGLHKGGKMLLSGLLKKDEQDLLLLINQHNMVHITTVEKDGWISILATS
jgi:ribosomal protein L11 methyltransferase